VALVHRLEEGHLWLTGQIHILCAVSNQLHKSTRHDSLGTMSQEKNLGKFI
jgi:hypothetical protein